MLPLGLAIWAMLSPKVVVSNDMTWDFVYNLAGAWHLWNGQTAHIDFRDPLGSLSFVPTTLGFELVGPAPAAFLVGACLVSIVAFVSATLAALRRLPHGAAAERRIGDPPLLLAPAVEAIEAGDGAVPACRRYPVIGIVAASLTMIGVDIVAGRSPHGLAAGIEKAKPDYDIIGIGAKRVPRSNTRQRQVEKEAIQIGIIERIVPQDQRHMRIEALGLAALANSNDRHRRETLPPDPPPGS